MDIEFVMDIELVYLLIHLKHDNINNINFICFFILEVIYNYVI